MFDRDRFFDSADGHLIAWAGQLAVDGLAGYLDESSISGPDEPQSAFARDLGRWYDHDFIYAQASDQPATLTQLAAQNYITDSELIGELEEHGNGQLFNCFVILWNARPVASNDRRFADGELACIGDWAHASPFDT